MAHHVGVAVADMRAELRRAAADLLHVWEDSGVGLPQQYDLVMDGITNIRSFCGLEDSRVGFRGAMAVDLVLDPTIVGVVGKQNRLALAALVTAWEAGSEISRKEIQMRAESKVLRITRPIGVVERQAMKRAVELVHGKVPDREAPSSDYLAAKSEELENNDPTASPLDEITCQEDPDLSVAVPGWDATGKQQLYRKRAKGTLPASPEAFRLRLRIERNTWLYLLAKFPNREWLVGITPKLFDSYTDYFLGERVLLLEVSNAEGKKVPLSPPWLIVLDYELSCRRKVFRMILEGTHTMETAMEAVVKDVELKEFCFTSAVAHLGRGRSGPSNSGAVKQWGVPGVPAAPGQGKNFNRNKRRFEAFANWNGAPALPVAPIAAKGKGRGRGKGKGKGKGKGNLHSMTMDGRQICFAFDSDPSSCAGDCGRVHVCRKCRVEGHSSANCTAAGA